MSPITQTSPPRRYEHTGYRWVVTVPGRNGWCQQFPDTEAEARALAEAPNNPPRRRA